MTISPARGLHITVTYDRYVQLRDPLRLRNHRSGVAACPNNTRFHNLARAEAFKELLINHAATSLERCGACPVSESHIPGRGSAASANRQTFPACPYYRRTCHND